MKSTTMKTIAIRTITFMLLLGVASLAMAQGHGGGCACGKHSASKISWQIEHPGSAAAYAPAAQAEFARWNTYIDIFSATNGDGQVGLNNVNEIMFLTTSQASQWYDGDLNPDTFGYAEIKPSTAFGNFNACPKPASASCGTFTETDVIMNADFARGWTPDAIPDFDDNSGPAMYGATAVHEIGHTLGFHHNFDNVSTMNYYEDYAARYIGMSDAAIARSHYAAQAKSVSDLSALPFWYEVPYKQYDGTEPMSLSATSVAAGGKVNIRNFTIENVGTSSMTNVNLRFYLSTDTTITTGDHAIGSVTAGTLGANFFADDEGKGFDFTIPNTVPAGTYYVGAVITNGSSNTTDGVTYNNAFYGAQRLTVTGGQSTGPCTPNAETMCLNNSRFKVQVSWRTSDGQTGSGKVGPPLTGDTGNFWFFSSNNLELMIKILDARVINGKFWVFYGALSNVQYTITVTDTQTGQSKQYNNAQGNLASVADVTAF
jgi:hypothetical protein